MNLQVPPPLIALLLLLLLPHVRSFVAPSRTAAVLLRSLHVLDESSGGGSSDFITSIFERFLPKPEQVGLSRFTPGSNPEKFPPTKSRSAALLPSDKGDVALVRPLLAGTNLETRELQVLFSGNKDSYSKIAFHNKVDRKGPCIILCRCREGGKGFVFGGYNPTGWVNLGEYRGSIAAFLYVYKGEADIKSGNAVKLSKIGGAGLAQIDDGSGPRFGSEGLTILLDRANPRRVRCKLGLYYEKMPNGDNSLLPERLYDDELTDFVVYGGVYAPGEKVPYNDALPFQLN